MAVTVQSCIIVWSSVQSDYKQATVSSPFWHIENKNIPLNQNKYNESYVYACVCVHPYRKEEDVTVLFSLSKVCKWWITFCAV